MEIKPVRRAPQKITFDLTEGAKQLSLSPLTSAQIAEKLGVTRVCVNHWRTGRTRPQYERTLEIGRILGINPVSWNFRAGFLPEDKRLAGEHGLRQYVEKHARTGL